MISWDDLSGATIMTLPARSDFSSSTRKPYSKPTLVKGPLLSDITALKGPVVSGTIICWVARAAFGENDIRWLIFRAWLLEDAPAWFRVLYIRYGARVGDWLQGRDNIRRLVRAMMMPAIDGKLRK
jgi:hypothetical protein